MPENNITLFSWDDVATRSENPYPGKLFNKPSPFGTPGLDVYKDCKVTVRHTGVTPVNICRFLWSTYNMGFYLKSNERSRVFLYFTGKGGSGIFDINGPKIYADEFNETLWDMHKAKKFKELVIYFEGSYTATMFKGFSLPPNVYVATSSDSTEQSYDAYCGADAKVDGVAMNTCLGSVWSDKLFEIAASTSPGSESLDAMFNTAKSQTHAQKST